MVIGIVLAALLIVEAAWFMHSRRRERLSRRYKRGYTLIIRAIPGRLNAWTDKDGQ